MQPRSLKNNPAAQARIALACIAVAIVVVMFLIWRKTGDSEESTQAINTVATAYGFSDSDETLTIYEIDAVSGTAVASDINLAGFIASSVHRTAGESFLLNLAANGNTRFPVLVAHPDGTRTNLDSASNSAVVTPDGETVAFLELVTGTASAPVVNSIGFFYPGTRNVAALPLTTPIPTSVPGYDPATDTLTIDDGSVVPGSTDAASLSVAAELIDISPSNGALLVQSGAAYYIVDFETGDVTPVALDAAPGATRVVYEPAGNLRVVTDTAPDGRVTYIDLDPTSFAEVTRFTIPEALATVYPASLDRTADGSFVVLASNADGVPSLQIYDIVDAPVALVTLDRAMSFISL